MEISASLKSFRTMKQSNLNSSFVNTYKLNRSRSALMKSVIHSNLKTTNMELAKALSERDREIGELRRENSRLLRENYDLMHFCRFRKSNYESFMNKFYDLSGGVMTLFNEVTQLSNGLLEIRNHAYLAEDVTNDVCVNYHEDNDSNKVNDTNETQVPSPFLSRDKILRSPMKSSNPSVVSKINSFEELSSKIHSAKNTSVQSIHNLSAVLSGDQGSLFHQRLESSHKLVNDCHTVDISKQSVEKSFKYSRASEKSFTKPIKSDLIKVPMSDAIVVVRGSRKPVNKKIHDDLDKSVLMKKIKSKKKKKNLTLKIDHPPDKEQYLKNKADDAYYLSFNETANATVLPSTLNEYKGQNQKDDNNIMEVNKDGEEKVQSSQIVGVNDIDNDDDDFVITKAFDPEHPRPGSSKADVETDPLLGLNVKAKLSKQKSKARRVLQPVNDEEKIATEAVETKEVKPNVAKKPPPKRGRQKTPSNATDNNKDNHNPIPHATRERKRQPKKNVKTVDDLKYEDNDNSNQVVNTTDTKNPITSKRSRAKRNLPQVNYVLSPYGPMDKRRKNS